MTTDHEGVRELLAAWAFGALQPGDERTVRPHLADCDSCAAEAARLRETVRVLDGPPSDAPSAGGSLNGGAPAQVPEAGGVLALALRSRRPASAPGIAPHAAPYAAAVSALQALLRELDGDGDRDGGGDGDGGGGGDRLGRGAWGTPVVHDWDVHDTVAHLLAADEPLALRLGLDRCVPASPSEEDARWEDSWALRTAEVIAHEQRRDPRETVAAWAAQAAALLATPEARDLELASTATTLMGTRLPVADHFTVRAFEVWIHTDDIGRALGLAVPPPPDPHLWRLVHLAVRILGTALGPEAPPVLFAVTGGAQEWVLGSEDEPVRAELVLDPVDFCLLVGGRYAPDEVPRGETGDREAVRTVLERAASLAWL